MRHPINVQRLLESLCQTNLIEGCGFEPRKPKPVYFLPVKNGIMSFWHMGDGIYDVNITLRRSKD